MPDPAGHHLSDDMLACIEVCTDCHKACLQTVPHCLQMGGAHAEANHVRLLLDCAEICQTSANFMLRGSDLHAATCAACAAVCERCADDCEQLSADDPRMGACAEMCRRCAESCRRMSGRSGAAAAMVRSAERARGHANAGRRGTRETDDRSAGDVRPSRGGSVARTRRGA